MENDEATFVVPSTKIKNVFDLNPWYFSKGYKDYLTFLRNLNSSVIGVRTSSDVICSPMIIDLVEMFEKIENWIEEIPLDNVDEQRFGNKAYRKFYEKLRSDGSELLLSVLPKSCQNAIIEIAPYFIESFGNATRIDYGSGHEANFMIFLMCLEKLKVFTQSDYQAIVLRVLNKYLKVCRFLQRKFNMEPAGSRGVHAIDDFQFVPFMFGSAQLIGSKNIVPDSYLKKEFVESHVNHSLFLEAIQYINETKTGPFAEHSNQLWNISAVPHWKKVNEGMFKMYEGEVLKKFPVVQHMMFGSLFSFDKRDLIDEAEKYEAPSMTNADVAYAQTSMPPRQPGQHGMFSFTIPSSVKQSSISSANVAESGDLRKLHTEKHPEEHCPPPMLEP